MSNIVIYTDGACRGNPGPGAFAYVILAPSAKPIKYAEAVFDTTNNRMELLAAIKALHHAQEAISSQFSISLHSDSNYLIQGMNSWLASWKMKNWKNSNRKSVKNKDLWLQLDDLNSTSHISWQWVKGHSESYYNNLCDELANHAIDQIS